MKLETCKTVDVEFEVEIGPEEISQALSQCVTRRLEGPQDARAVLELLSTLHMVASRVPDALLRLLNDKQRRILVEAFRRLADQIAGTWIAPAEPALVLEREYDLRGHVVKLVAIEGDGTTCVVESRLADRWTVQADELRAIGNGE